MENVVLVIHLILALCLIGVVLIQRSEGGGLGMGGGGGGVMTSRGAATALGKITWAFAIAFIVTSIVLTVLAARNAADSSVTDRLRPAQAEDVQLGDDAPAGTSGLGSGADLLPPSAGDDNAPVTPPRAD